MTKEKFKNINHIYFDTAPIIYFIEANPKYKAIMKNIVLQIKKGKKQATTSTVTLMEVLTKPYEVKSTKLINLYKTFLKNKNSIELLDLSADIADEAGKLRGKYTFLKAMDAIQMATAIIANAEIFITNDKQLKKVKEIKTLVLEDYLHN